jgi:hypothetical protein
MKNRTRISSFIALAGLVCIAIFMSSNKVHEPNNSSKTGTQREMPKVFPPEIPRSVNFAGETIDLTLQDRRERMDKELLSFTYAHTNTMLIIKRANRLFPIVEPILKEYGIPDDFKYLMIIESNGDPEAISQAKAGGLWQFLERTGRDYGLEINDRIDERFHIEKATRAACKFLKDSYRMFGDWITVAASYNTGRANITKRQESQKENKAINLVLPNETSRYIFRLMAAKTILENPARYGFILRSSDLYPPIPIKRIAVASGDTIDWADFAKEHGLTFMQLHEANHWIRRTYHYNRAGKLYKVQIPSKSALRYNPSKTKAHNPKWVIK